MTAEHHALTAPDGLQAAPALEPMPDSLLPPDVLDTIIESCRVLLKAGHEQLCWNLWNIGSWLEQQQQESS